MSLRPRVDYAVPEQTMCVTRALFRNVFIRIRDGLGAI